MTAPNPAMLDLLTELSSRLYMLQAELREIGYVFGAGDVNYGEVGSRLERCANLVQGIDQVVMSTEVVMRAAPPALPLPQSACMILTEDGVLRPYEPKP